MSKDKITYFSFTEDLSGLLFLAASTSCAFTMDPFVPDDRVAYLPKDPVSIAEFVSRDRRHILIVPTSTPTSAFMHDTRDGNIKEDYEVDTPISAVAVAGLHFVLKTQNAVAIFHIDNIAPPQILPSFKGNERSLAVSKVQNCENEPYFVVAFPGEAQGTISIASCPTSVAKPQYDDGKGGEEPKCTITHTISAHDGFVSLLAISEDGTLVASVSDEGTYIRVFRVGPSEPQVIERTGVHREFYRGYNQCTIAAMRISPSKEILAVLSTNGTCHLYGLTDNIENYWRWLSPNRVMSYCNIYCGKTDVGEIRFGPDSRTMYVACSNGKCTKYSLEIDDSKHIVAKELLSNTISVL